MLVFISYCVRRTRAYVQDLNQRMLAFVVKVNQAALHTDWGVIWAQLPRLAKRTQWSQWADISDRLPGHDPRRDLVMLPIEIVSPRDPFLLRSRERFNIWKFETEKRMGVQDIERGLNLDPGQV